MSSSPRGCYHGPRCPMPRPAREGRPDPLSCIAAHALASVTSHQTGGVTPVSPGLKDIPPTEAGSQRVTQPWLGPTVRPIPLGPGFRWRPSWVGHWLVYDVAPLEPSVYGLGCLCLRPANTLSSIGSSSPPTGLSSAVIPHGQPVSVFQVPDMVACLLRLFYGCSYK